MNWDHPELTDEELLVYDIEDDAAIVDSHALSHRQQNNWDEFTDRMKHQGDYALEALDKSLAAAKSKRATPTPIVGGAYFLRGVRNEPELPKHPTWWELWTPPKGAVSGSDPIGVQLLKRGVVTIRDEQRTRDVHSWNNPLRTLVESYTIYMDFKPDDEWSFYAALSYAGFSSAGDYQKIRGPWGWWQGGNVGFRQIVRQCKYTSDPDHPERGYTGFAAQMLYPPPYGCWLPALDFDRLGNT